MVKLAKTRRRDFLFARSQFVDSEVLALKRMLFVVFLLRPFPLGGMVGYAFRFPVYLSQRWTPFPIYFSYFYLTAASIFNFICMYLINVYSKNCRVD